MDTKVLEKVANLENMAKWAEKNLAYAFYSHPTELAVIMGVFSVLFNTTAIATRGG